MSCGPPLVYKKKEIGDLLLKYPTTNDVILVNQKLANAYGFKRAVIQFGNLDFCVYSMMDVQEMTNLKDTIIRKAAMVCTCLIVSHCFYDGNKRTAFEIMRSFLTWNNVELKRYDLQDTLDMLTAVSAGTAGENAISSWLVRNVR